MNVPCVLCGAAGLRYCGRVGVRDGSVTSDSRPCPLPARVWQCERCGHLQKSPDAEERAAIQRVYSAYAAHHLSGGREQLTFVPGRPPVPRSQHAFELVRPGLPSTGRLLDVGTGAGAILATAHAVLPAWELHAFDLSDRRRAEIERLPGVRGFYSGDLDAIPDVPFDLIVLWHVLEHIQEPGRVLQQLRTRLARGGRILIQVPDVDRNTYDLAVLDHVSHFSARHLNTLARASGLAVVVDGRHWFHNCLTVALVPSNRDTPAFERAPTGDSPADALNASVRHFDAQRGDGDYAIFGTGMAGIWLAGQFDPPPVCFLDEDASRWGQTIAGTEVRGPQDVGDVLPVIMAFDAPTGEAIASRLRREYQSLNRCPLIVSPAAVAS